MGLYVVFLMRADIAIFLITFVIIVLYFFLGILVISDE